MTRKDLWTREQTIVALNLYCKIPFGKIHSTNPDIIKVANIIGRSVNSLKMKLGNLANFDENLRNRGVVGLTNTSKLDEKVWNEFNNNWEQLAYESELLISKFSNQSIEESAGIDLHDIPIGKERESIVKQRINQNFFRSTILSSYNSKCCITGLSIPDFLVASHIKPWSKDEKNRLNPHNGLCLNTAHDRAFDQGFITITSDYKVSISKYFDEYTNDGYVQDLFLKYEKRPITLPERFIPSAEFLDYHRQTIFKG